ncbi:hypothetical protein MRB53_001443 [Persea americana]|uniref:Uncharacterized protein n=1 Tax=Persea americana TaxID=3435 RepID=A0ACC2MS05_PERAE|nr:hypothetical protein MRB53_001443 [Persea americana]
MQVLASPRSFVMDTSCGALLRELQQMWNEIGESEVDKDRMLLELEKECLDVYRRKVDEASNAKARLHQAVASKEAELAALMAALGELNLQSQTDKRLMPLKEQLASVSPVLEDLRIRKEERIKQFADIKAQIEKINGEISGCYHLNDAMANHINVDEHDLSLRKLNECQTHLRSIQKEKSDRLHKVLEYINEVHSLCGVLGLDFGKTVSEVHPSLRETGPGNSTNISNNTLDGLAQNILKLKLEKKNRVQKDVNRYSAGRGAHVNLKRAERARVTVNKIPGIIDNLINRAFAWEGERNMPFLYDGVRLVVILEEYKLTRQQKEEEKKRFRDQKKLRDMLLTERESIYGSKPSPKRSNSIKKQNGVRANGNGSMTPTPRRYSVGSATPELLTPRSCTGRQNGYFKQMRRLSTAPLNFVALPKEDTISFASFCGSEPGSPLQG